LGGRCVRCVGERAAQERASAEVADRFCKRFCKRTLRDVVSPLRRCGTWATQAAG